MRQELNLINDVASQAELTRDPDALLNNPVSGSKKDKIV